MKYPGRVIKAGESDESIVKALKLRLNQVLNDESAKLDPDNGEFGPHMQEAVSLFQARNVDGNGQPLKQDGQIGSLTWAALFGDESVTTHTNATTPLLQKVLAVAQAAEARKVREVPINSNCGPEVEAFLASVGVPPGNSWCCAFVYWCFQEAAKSLSISNPMVKTAGCIDHWHRAASHGATRVTSAQALDNPELVTPGMIFIMDHGSGKGHTGLVEQISGGLLTTIEGNTNASKTREGGGVYRLTRKISEINAGFIFYP